MGEPDLSVEILSPSTAYKDENDKHKLYESNGVREYWVVAPKGEYILVYTLEKNRFMEPRYFRSTDTLTSRIFEGLEIELSGVFLN